MVPATPLLLAMTTTAATRMPLSPLLRLASGSRPTLSSSSPTLTPLSKRASVKLGFTRVLMDGLAFKGVVA